MAHIKAPVPITGTHVTLNFVNGEADTDRPWLIQWFREHGYEVSENGETPKSDDPPANDPETPPDGGQTGQDGPENGGESNDPPREETPAEGAEKGKNGETPKPRRKRSQ